MNELEYLILIGKRIRLFRSQKKFRQKKLADLVGCSDSLISLAERGRAKLDLEKYRGIANSLGVPVELLLTEKDLSNDQLFAMAKYMRILTSSKPTPNYNAINRLIEDDITSLNGRKK